jgi:hypothetical protein
MRRRVKGCALALAGPLVLAGCASGGLALNSWKDVSDRVVAPYELRRECLALRPGERLEYVWESTQPVMFNLHYRSGGGVVMPISRDDVTGDAGIFTVVLAHEYCLMWEARENGALVSYRFRRRSADE